MGYMGSGEGKWNREPHIEAGSVPHLSALLLREGISVGGSFKDKGGGSKMLSILIFTFVEGIGRYGVEAIQQGKTKGLNVL